MQVKDVMAGVPIDAPALRSTQNPFLHSQLLDRARLSSIVIDVLAGTASVLLELGNAQRSAPRATTGLLRVSGLAQQDWICTAAVDEFTAWSITRAIAHISADEFQFTARCLPAGGLRVVGASAEFVLLDTSTSTPVPPAAHADPRTLHRFGLADPDTACEIIGVARSAEQLRGTPSGS